MWLERSLLRRTRQTLFAGVKIFDGVPDSVNQTLTWSLSAEERTFYNIVVDPMQKELQQKEQELPRKKLEASDGATHTDIASGGYMASKTLSLFKLTAHPFLLESIMLNDKFLLSQLQDIEAGFRSSATVANQ